jgi:hypothetical protein
MMNNPRDIFHKISYLQYPLVVVGGYYYVLFIISMINQSFDWSALNYALIFYGISISLSTLQDTTKTQNKISQRIWEDPKKGKIAIMTMVVMVALFMSIGLIGILSSTESVHKEISFGLIVLSIGLIGMLKAAIEMYENHRLDKKLPFDDITENAL